MEPTTYDILQTRERSNWVRLRTLVALRYFAVAGQALAILVATQVYGLTIAVGPATAVIGASVIVNLVSVFVFPVSRRLSEREATAVLTFDILQLAALLFLTGGLSNPFALLMLAPVTIAASVLHTGSVLSLGALAMVLLTVIGEVSLPLVTAGGDVLTLPPLFRFGFWVALIIGVVFLGLYARQVTTEMHSMGEALLATQLALAREQKLTDLGGVVAAAAHELGTPLATIKLVSSELVADLPEGSDAQSDARLIGEQAERCRRILRSMGRAGKDDLHLKTAPFEAILEEAAEPHVGRGRAVEISAEGSGDMPVVQRRPEIIHGLRNLVQNAVDFATESVDVVLRWDADRVTVRIADDGPGFAPSVLARIGDPFVRRRRGDARRPGYDGMGLGLFIAKTLLERSGAALVFGNGRGGGATVTVTWPRGSLDRGSDTANKPLGENRPFLP